MLRFPSLEDIGVRVAAFSSKEEGDCRPGKPGRAAFLAACGVAEDSVVSGVQVHGVHVVRVDDTHRGLGAADWDAGVPETDALMTSVPGLPLSLLVADCVPVYLADTMRRVIGLAHAGRRGTRHGIASRLARAMIDDAGCLPEDIHAVIGPSAGPGKYEVSEEMADDWRQVGLPSNGRLLDLWKSNEAQLAGEGVHEKNIIITARCTISEDFFYSYRRDGNLGRNMAVLML